MVVDLYSGSVHLDWCVYMLAARLIPSAVYLQTEGGLLSAHPHDVVDALSGQSTVGDYTNAIFNLTLPSLKGNCGKTSKSCTIHP